MRRQIGRDARRLTLRLEPETGVVSLADAEDAHGAAARDGRDRHHDEIEQQLSAQRHIDNLHTPLVLCIGTLETPEFQRQSRDFVAAVKAAGKPAELVVGQHYNHFEVGDTIGHPYQLIGRELMKMMKLSMT